MDFPQLSLTQWIIGCIAAVTVGLGKGGLPGVGNLAIVLMAWIFPTKSSVAILLPILICADIVAVVIYRHHAQWSHLIRILPSALVGILIGTWILDKIENQNLTRLIGAILLVLVLIRFIKPSSSINNEDSENSLHPFWTGFTGITGGVATMIANAAGPVISIYLLLSKLPKYALIGTTAWFFFIINLSKLPLQASIQNLTWNTLSISLCFGIVAIVSAALAPQIVKRISEKLFVQLIWAFVIIAGLKMLVLG